MVPTIDFPQKESAPLLYATITFCSVLSYVEDVTCIVPVSLLKTTGVPNDTDVPDTVPTIAVPWLELPPSEQATKVFCAFASYALDILLDTALLNTTAEPNDIEVPLTVHTIDVPQLELAESI